MHKNNSYKQQAQAHKATASNTLAALLILALGCVFLASLATTADAIATINIWKHRYPFYGGYGGYYPFWGGYGGYGGGYGGISLGGGGYGRR